MSDNVRVYRMDVVVVDHDQLGPDGARQALENARFPNDCMSPEVIALEEREVEWCDDHPLNQRDGRRAAVDALFAPAGRCLRHTDPDGPDEHYTTPFDPAEHVKCPCPGGCPGTLRADGKNGDGTLLFLCCAVCKCAHVIDVGAAFVGPQGSRGLSIAEADRLRAAVAVAANESRLADNEIAVLEAAIARVTGVIATKLAVPTAPPFAGPHLVTDGVICMQDAHDVARSLANNEQRVELLRDQLAWLREQDKP